MYNGAVWSLKVLLRAEYWLYTVRGSILNNVCVFIQYQRAVAKALIDRVPDEKVSDVTVV